MGIEINLNLTISFLLPAVFMLLMAACGGSGEPTLPAHMATPDIDATVEVSYASR